MPNFGQRKLTWQALPCNHDPYALSSACRYTLVKFPYVASKHPRITDTSTMNKIIAEEIHVLLI